MRHRKYTFKIGRTSSHRRAMLANMAGSLIENGEIRTTVVRAKELKRFVEKMITYAKKGDLHHRRLAVARLGNKKVVKMLFEETALKFADRNGGYTRIIRLGTRIGDAADTCMIQWVGEGAPVKKSRKTAKAEKIEAAPVEETAQKPEGNAEK